MAAPDRASSILVVEDDLEFREEILIPCLSEAGFDVAQAANTREMYRQLLLKKFDLILLDVGLPDEDGYSALEHISQACSSGVIMLTGRQSPRDHIRGLTTGADTYLCKPIDPDILIATLNSVLRRLRNVPRKELDSTKDIINRTPNGEPNSDIWEFNTSHWRLTAPNGKSVQLNPYERIILSQLSSAPGKVINKDILIEHISEKSYDFDQHRLEVVIHRLRRKVLDATNIPLPLTTIRNVGYILDSQTGTNKTVN